MEDRKAIAERDYSDEARMWKRFLQQASELALGDLQRHARVSIRNRCECGMCFCCACKTELIKRYAGIDGRVK